MRDDRRIDKRHVRSEASKAKQSASVKGVPKSPEHRAAISAAAKARYAREGEREKTAAAVKAAKRRTHP
ncbi:MAG TPA: hypothetical protein VGR63_19240 [Casimicrobiaceae bacterium]|jgi:hypothetical protein|nr:hypothetical protein [Casimicrobiaceae bacterium]